MALAGPGSDVTRSKQGVAKRDVRWEQQEDEMEMFSVVSFRQGSTCQGTIPFPPPMGINVLLQDSASNERAPGISAIPFIDRALRLRFPVVPFSFQLFTLR